jgi:hypothetical protein
MAVSRESADARPVTRRERRVDRARWVPAVGPGMVLGVLATIALVVTMFMAWRNDTYPSDVPVAFLFDSATTAQNPSLLIALIPLAVILAVGSLLPRASGARILGGLGVLVVTVLFAIQLNYLADRTAGASAWDQLQTGFYIAAVAGLVALVSGFMTSGWTRRRTSETEADIDDEHRQRFRTDRSRWA